MDKVHKVKDIQLVREPQNIVKMKYFSIIPEKKKNCQGHKDQQFLSNTCIISGSLNNS